MLPLTESRQVAVEGVRFRLHRAGAGDDAPPALLLHGVPETALAWRHLVPALATDRVVLAPDLKGLGGSEVAAPYDVPALVAELAALVLHEVDAPVDVVGHDWGGVLGIGLAAARPDLVRRLVVLSAPYRRIDPIRAAHVPFFALPALPEAAFALGGRVLIRWMLRRCWRAPGQLEPEVAEHYAAAYADPARVRAMLGYYRATARPRALPRPLRPARARLGRPRPDRALVVWGCADPVLPLPVGEAAVRDLGPGARFATLPGVGHLPHEEAPQVTTELVTSFLTG